MNGKNEIKLTLQAAGIAYTDEALQSIGKLLDAIHAVFGCTLDDLKSRKRSEILSYARRVWFWCAKDILIENSAKKMAKTINKHTTSVAYSLKMYENDMKFNKKFERYAEMVSSHLDNNP
jgi:chromosomal replication initiation ATPase DnaA